MKKILYLITLLLMATACDWFEFDNMDGYDATITGQFLDATTNQPIQFGVPDNYAFTLYEENFQPSKGTFVPSAITWYAKTNGTYTNNLVFSGDYRIQTVEANNFYPITEQFSINKGNNTKNFNVTPYARVKDVNISYDSATKELVAKFKVEFGDATKTNGMIVYFLGAKDRFVGKNNNNFTDATAIKKWVEPNTEVELRVNTQGGNNSEFIYTQPHYVRIAVMAAHCAVVSAYDEEVIDWGAWWMAGMPEDKTPFTSIVHHDAEYNPDGTVNAKQVYNYSSVYKVSEDFGTITEVNDWN